MMHELIQAFETARYHVKDPEMEIKINEINPELDSLLSRHNARSWAFITPYNPGSEIISDEENKRRLETLRIDVEGLTTFEGTGGGQSGEWPLERSLLILKIGKSKAWRLGKAYGQDAIVVGQIRKPAEILVLNPEIS